MKKLLPMVFLASVALSQSQAVAEGESAPRFPRRWFYSMTNLQVSENADSLIALIERAGKAGYNGVVLADYKLNVLDRVPEYYFKNVKRVQKAADAAGVEIIPTVFPIGYSNGLLAHDPNLAEGMEVRSAPFVVKGREAGLDPASKASLLNGGFEETRGDTFRGFGYQDGPGADTFADHSVYYDGKASCRFAVGGPGEVRRVIQKVNVRPHACYRLSGWVKTAGLSTPNAFRLLAIGAGTSGGGKSLTFFEGGVAADQDWTPVEVVFNSLDQTPSTSTRGSGARGRGPPGSTN